MVIVKCFSFNRVLMSDAETAESAFSVGSSNSHWTSVKLKNIQNMQEYNALNPIQRSVKLKLTE